MRDLLIISIVLGLAVLALWRPWIGVMNWTWLSIMNPHRYAWGFAYSAPVAMIAAASTLVGLMFTKERQSPFQGAPTVWLLVFALWVTLSWRMGLDPEGDYQQWDKVIKIYFMTFVVLALLCNKHHLMAFIWVTIGSLTLLATKGGVFTILHGGSYMVWGPAGSFIADNNHFALAVIITIPMLHFLQLQFQKLWMRHIMSVVMLLSVACALGSHSRGAFLAIMAMGAIFWWRSQKKGVMTVLFLFAIMVILPIMPQEWWDRMGTIQTYEEDASAMGRINGWLVALQVAQHNFFGGGMSYQHEIYFLMYGVYNTDVIAAHSIYFQVLGNHGFIGLFLYLMIWFSTYRCAGWLRKHARAIPQAQWAAHLGAMVQASLVGFLVGGAFLSMPYFDLPYNLMVMVVLAKKWVQTRGWERDPPMSFWEYLKFWGRPSVPASRITVPTPSQSASNPASLANSLRWGKEAEHAPSKLRSLKARKP